MLNGFSQWLLSFRKTRGASLWTYAVPTLLSGLALASLFALGPLVQAVVVAILSGESSSIYDSENVSELASFSAYLTAALWPPYLAGGVFSAIAMLLASTKRTVFASGTIAIALSLTLIDLSSGVPEGLASSILCNVAAGAILASLTLILILDNQVIRRVANGNEKVERIIWLVAPATGFFALATILFSALGFLTRVPKTPVSFRLEPSLNGYYVTEMEQQCSMGNRKELKQCTSVDGKENSKFSFLGKFSETDGGRTEFLGGGSGLKIEWSTAIEGSTRGSLWVTQGCVGESADYENAIKSSPLYSGDIRNLAITVDDGLTDFRIIDPKPNRFTVSDEGVAQFWINPSRNNPEKIDVSRFLGNGIIQVNDKSDTTKFSLGLISLTKNEKGTQFKTRRATYSINDDEKRLIEFNLAPEMIEARATIACEGLEVEQHAGKLSATTKVPYISLVVSLEAPRQLSLDDMGKLGHVTISAANGWIKSTGYRKDQLHEAITEGTMSQLSLIGVVRDMVVDGEVISTGPTSTLQLSGKMYARTDGPAILVEGSANYLIFNGKRLSRTRWERLDAGVRIPIILGVPTAAFFLLNFARTTLRRPIRLVWRLPGRTGKPTSKARYRRGSRH
jgi:hypothetical protein